MSIRNPKSAIRNPLRVLVLVGPTASGKTDVALELARLLDGEIISADSRQVYKFLDIGTAKPTADQRSSVKHYFVDDLLPDENFSAGEFGEKGRRVINEIFSRKKTPIVAGGSGLYIQSLIDGFFEGPGSDKEYRKSLEQKITQGKLNELMQELRSVDPVSAERIDPTKPRRIIRALEVFHLTGKPLSDHHAESGIKIDFMPVIFGLEWKRESLYKRIEQRCDEMMDNGLVEEIESLKQRGYSSSLNALNTVGYAEAFSYTNGSLSYDEMVRLFKQNSRRYAKRQMTWFRKDKRIHWLPVNDKSSARQIATKIATMFIEAQAKLSTH